MIGVHVADGTNAGARVVRQRPSWECDCILAAIPCDSCDYGTPLAPCTCLDSAYDERRRVHDGSRYSCPDCGARRDG